MLAPSDFEKFLEPFDSDAKKRGTQWEHVCQWFLETDPVYRTPQSVSECRVFPSLAAMANIAPGSAAQNFR